jgi:hypothetical protein
MSVTTPSHERSAETSNTRAVLIGTMNYPVCSDDCGREMIAANPQHTCTIQTVVIREDKPTCSWCMKPIAVAVAALIGTEAIRQIDEGSPGDDASGPPDLRYADNLGTIASCSSGS